MSELTGTGAKPCIICADDYGYTETTSAQIASLLASGAVNATTCLVESACWGDAGARLRTLCGQARPPALGLHLNLTEHFEQTPLPAPRLAFDRSTRFVEQIYRRFQRQWDAYVSVMHAPPDFMDGHQHVHLSPGAQVALFRLAQNVAFKGWLRQCRTSSRRRSAKRLLLDPLSAAFAAAARQHGYACNPGFGGLRRFRDDEDVLTLWRVDLSAMPNGGVLMVHPGGLSKDDAIGPCRVQEARLLPVLHASLAGLGFAMAANPRQPW